MRYPLFRREGIRSPAPPAAPHPRRCMMCRTAAWLQVLPGQVAVNGPGRQRPDPAVKPHSFERPLCKPTWTKWRRMANRLPHPSCYSETGNRSTGSSAWGMTAPSHRIITYPPSRSDALVLVMWCKTIDNGIPVCYNMFSFCYWMVKIKQLGYCLSWIVRGPSINHSERK